ncbi:MAG: hypothetical protein N3G19_03640, partial [Candidatus Pacearchaeota archaeon]|nr:hypothetical protein [Candidatus Pacearchaeota archaeon]
PIITSIQGTHATSGTNAKITARITPIKKAHAPTKFPFFLDILPPFKFKITTIMPTVFLKVLFPC